MNVKDRPRLGRGLKSLISSPTIVHAGSPDHQPIMAHAPADGLIQVPLTHLDPNPFQPREVIDPVALADLVASIKSSGVLQPIIVRQVGERFVLIAGHRRSEAAKQAGLHAVPAVVRNDSTEEQQAEWALMENIQRQDLNPVERAKAYRNYIERFNLTQAQAAQRLGEDRTVIANFLRILDLNLGVQDLVGRGILSAGHAKVLAGVTEKARQDALANRAATEGLSVRKLEELVAQTPTAVAQTTDVVGHTRTLIAKSAHIVELEQDLSRRLGTKLRIFPSKKKSTGKIVIQYFSLDEFDRIVEKFEEKAAKS